ncbi:hypothetical protein FRC06_004846, partial [Ceratobasidium sp. 370]
MQTVNDEDGPHSMRIAAHGKISGLVTFALKFLKDTNRQDGKGVSATEPVAKKRKIAPSTNDIPRLISVVEIIKREFTDAPLHQYNELGCLDEPIVEGGAVRAL